MISSTLPWVVASTFIVPSLGKLYTSPSQLTKTTYDYIVVGGKLIRIQMLRHFNCLVPHSWCSWTCYCSPFDRKSESNCPPGRGWRIVRHQCFSVAKVCLIYVLEMREFSTSQSHYLLPLSYQTLLSTGIILQPPRPAIIIAYSPTHEVNFSVDPPPSVRHI